MTTRNLVETLTIPSECYERFLPLQAACAAPLRERGVVMAGISDLYAPFEVVRVESPFHAVVYTLEGGARYTTPQGTGEIGVGDLWVGSAPHRYSYQAREKWRVLWFHLADNARWSVLSTEAPGVRSAPHASLVRSWSNAVEEYLAETTAEQKDAFVTARAYAEIIGVYLERVVGENANPAQLQTLHQLNVLWEKVDANLAYAWTVEAMAAMMHVSPTHFYRMVAQWTEASPMERVTQLRMRRAAEMLRGSSDTLEHIARAVGYGGAIAFSKAFRRQFGCSPGQFRASTTATVPPLA